LAGEIAFSPVGIAHTSASDEDVREMGKDLEYTIELFPEYTKALDGIDGFSHLIVLFYFDRLRPEQKGVLRVKPKKFLRRGLTLDELPWLGVFALDSPSRPNPIGFSIVEFVRHDGLRLEVRGLEAFDGTPVLDIKPCSPERLVPAVKVPRWFSDLEGIAKKREPKRAESKKSVK
jgi:tRNA-Thr(GGU) m(6)t(6)A37 methyltransferase TsaA